MKNPPWKGKWLTITLCYVLHRSIYRYIFQRWGNLSFGAGHIVDIVSTSEYPFENYRFQEEICHSVLPPWPSYRFIVIPNLRCSTLSVYVMNFFLTNEARCSWVNMNIRPLLSFYSRVMRFESLKTSLGWHMC